MASLLISVAVSVISGAIMRALAPDQEGPRLKDLHLQDSTYGQMIPIAYGTDRLAGQVIWKTDLVEHKHKSGGKGSGPTTTTYTYTASFDVLICEQAIDPNLLITDVLMIWANGEIIYDATGAVPDLDTIPVTFYFGEETQLPDPTEEAELGAGNVPAYRGRVRAVFKDWDLGKFGNTIPQLNFLIAPAITGCSVSQVVANDLVTYAISGPCAWTGYDAVNHVLRLQQFPSGGGSFGQGPTTPTTATTVSTFLFDSTNLSQNGSDSTSDPYPSEFDLIGPDALHPGFVVDNRYRPMGFFVYASGVSKPLWYSADHVQVSSSTSNVTIGDVNTVVNPTDGYQSICPTGDFAYVCGVPAGRYLRAASFSADGKTLFLFTDTVATRFAGGSFTPCFSEWWKIQDGATVATGTCAGPYGAFIRQADFLAYGHGGNISLPDMATCFDSDLKHCWYARYDQIQMFHIDAAGVFQRDNTCGSAPLVGTIGPVSVFAFKSGYCVTLTNINGDPTHFSARIFTRYPTGATSDVSLYQIVADISNRCGLSAPDYDVTQLTDIVKGYVIKSQMSGRDALAQLRKAYFFDAVESAGVLKFVKRYGTPLLTIDANDLAAQSPGAQMPAVVEEKRAYENDLPATVSVTYVNPTAGWQEGTQVSKRLITTSQQQQTETLDISMDLLKAKQVADTLIVMAWIERNSFIFLTSNKHLFLEPTDVIIAGGYLLRIETKSQSINGVTKFEGKATFAGLWIQGSTSTAGSGYTPDSASPTQASQLILLDIPLLQDTDSPGFYAAMAGAVNPTWPGASLLQSRDGGTTYSNIDTQTADSVIGATNDVLAPFYGGNVFDEINSVTVVVGAGGGTPESFGREAILNGAGVWIIGHEILQAKNATLTAPSTYVLTGMLRGRRGTEWAMVGHQAGELAIYVPPLLSVAQASTDLFIERLYKAVTLGATFASATAVPFTNQANAWAPYAPVQLAGGVANGSGDVALEWVRRTRIGGTWSPYADVPLSEPTEQYVVQIWDASYTQCARIQLVTTPTWTYTGADQTTDFGALQSTIYFTVGQIGTYGVGFQARGTAPGAGSVTGLPLAPIAPYASGPSSPPPSGGPVDAILVWSPTAPVDTTSFVIGNVFVAKFTVGGTPPTSGSVAAAEFGDPPYYRRMRLCTDQAGTNVLAEVHGTTATVFFGSSAGLPLSASTDYYVLISCQLTNGNPSGAPGASANMRVELNHTP